MEENTGHFWWQTGVIYQVYPRSFKDSDGDGIGDLPGILEKLDYLTGTLGVDAIWISPFFPSPMKDFGYDISDYRGVDPIFGSLADFDALLQQSHQRNLKVIIDLVPNHTSDRHPWFLESRAARDNPKRDWYVWGDPKPDGSPPNNWLSNFGGPSWEWDEKTGQYYLHCFLKEQPDLNWRNPQVKRAMFDVVRYWLEKGVDGFRIDVAHYIMKDPELRDNPPNPAPSYRVHRPVSEYNTQLHLHDRGHPDVHAVYREFRKLLDEYSRDQPRMSIGEIHIFDWPLWASYYGEVLDELHMPFNFSLLNVGWRARAVRQVVDGLEAALPPGAWPNYVLGNHDVSRLATRIGAKPARLAAMLLLTLRGTPTLYNGDELGMTDVPVPPDQQQDPWGIQVPGQSRDPERSPMPWDGSPQAGFSPPGTPKTWLPVAPDHRQVSVRAQLERPDSMLNLYRRLLAYRRSSPALQAGSYTPLDGLPVDCFAYLRQEGDRRVLVALNFSGLEERLSLPALGQGHLVFSTALDRAGAVDLSDLSLHGYEGVVVEL